MDDSLIGRMVGPYQVKRLLGEGGMASVYLVYDAHLDRYAALKVLRIERRDMQESFTGRFDIEARSLAHLSHPNIVKIIDYGKIDEKPYFIMELLPNGTLKSRLGHPWQPGDAAAILIPIAQALAYAHSKGILHRDVKPSNILFSETSMPVLTDFGIAKVFDQSYGQASLTGSDSVVGTPEYMAPEQALGEKVDGRADIYSLGIIFYEMVTGVQPYTAETPLKVMMKQSSEPLTNPQRINPNVPVDVCRILYRALAKRPEDRYQSMSEFVSELEGIRMKYPTSGMEEKETKTQTAGHQKVLSQNGKHPAKARIAAAAAVLVLAAAVLIVWGFSGKKKASGGVPSAAETEMNLSVTSANQENPVTIPASVIQATDTAEVKPADSAGEENAADVIAESPAAAEIETADIFPTFTAEPSATAEIETANMLPTFTAEPSATEVPVHKAIQEMVREKDGMTMVLIPEGNLNCPMDNVLPEKKALFENNHVDAFWMDKTEVTYEEYNKCFTAGACSYSLGVVVLYTPDAAMVMIQEDEAEQYCNWAGGTLPSVVQWEWAARGAECLIYPWGNEINYNNAEFKGGNKNGETWNVNMHPEGASPFGVLNMAGNVSEWAGDLYRDIFVEKVPATFDAYAVMGGSTQSDADGIRSDHPEEPDTVWGGSRGFRCVVPYR